MLYLVKEEDNHKNLKKFINMLNNQFQMVYYYTNLGYYLEIFGRRNNVR